MMLLQAGQLGLSRRDSIWTDEIPPEMVAGATMWIDFTDSTTLFARENMSGGNVTSDGAAIGSIRSKVFEERYFNYAYSNDVPKLKLAAANGRSAGLFPVSAYSQMGGASGGAQMPISSLITSTTKLIICGVKVTGAGAGYSGSPWANDAVLNDTGGYTGLHLSQSGAVVSARAYNYVSSSYEAVQTFDADTWVVITMSHQSGQLRCRVNGGTWASTASGATGDVTGPATIANTGAMTLGMELAHLATLNTPQTDAAISAVEHWIANDLGITPWW